MTLDQCDSQQHFVAPASTHSVIVWQLRDNLTHVSKIVLTDSSERSEQQPQSQPQSEPSALAFDATGTLVALACDRVVQVHVIERREVLVTLEGHLARVRVVQCYHVFPTCPSMRLDFAIDVLLAGDQVRVPSDSPALAHHVLRGPDVQSAYSDSKLASQ